MKKLTRDEKIEIKRLWVQGNITQRELAFKYYISERTIRNVIKNPIEYE